MERFYRIAGIDFRVTGSAEQMYQEDGVLAAFRSEESKWDHTLDFRIVEQLDPAVGERVFFDPARQVFRFQDAQLRYEGAVSASLDEAYMRIHRHGQTSQVQVLRRALKDRITTKLILNALEAEHQIVQRGGFLLHAACVRWNGMAILFTAPSGTGKSTQAELWCRHRGAEMINGDRIAVYPEPSGVAAYGIPFAGSSGVCKNAKLPVAAIVYLSQAPAVSINPLFGLRAFRHLWEGCSVNVWNPADINRCTHTVMETVQRLPPFHLACTPDAGAVAALERELEILR